MTQQKRALITGVTGQDGSYMAEMLLEKGYEVHGMIRRSSGLNTDRIEHLWAEGLENGGERFIIHYGDLSDASSIQKIIADSQPDEVYHFGAQSHVRVSFDVPESTVDVDALGTLRILEALRTQRPQAKFYQASSSEMYGIAPAPQNEETPFMPQSPYAAAKLCSHWLAKNYRDAYKMFIVSGILFNHESPRRGENFVSRKITRNVARILAGKEKIIRLGNLDAQRDWGYAPEYVEAAWLMMQQATPDDFVIGTGEMHTVREFLEETFKIAGLGPIDKYVVFKEQHLRPLEVPALQADATKAKRVLGWEPQVRFKELVRIMLEEDCKKEGVTLPK